MKGQIKGTRETGVRKYRLLQEVDVTLLEMTKRGGNPHAIIQSIFGCNLTGIKYLTTKVLTGKVGELKQFARANK